MRLSSSSTVVNCTLASKIVLGRRESSSTAGFLDQQQRQDHVTGAAVGDYKSAPETEEQKAACLLLYEVNVNGYRELLLHV